jgi:Vacuolar 14 Fab1-binding region
VNIVHRLTSQELPQYLEKIVPPVLACFTDQDARVRYYACEAAYNIAKVAKGEILMYFNDIFDALCKVRGSRRFIDKTSDFALPVCGLTPCSVSS